MLFPSRVIVLLSNRIIICSWAGCCTNCASIAHQHQPRPPQPPFNCNFLQYFVLILWPIVFNFKPWLTEPHTGADWLCCWFILNQLFCYSLTGAGFRHDWNSTERDRILTNLVEFYVKCSQIIIIFMFGTCKCLLNRSTNEFCRELIIIGLRALNAGKITGT